VTRVVAIDTSTWWGGVALVEGGGAADATVVAEAGLRVADSHSHHLIRLLDRLLAESGWAKRAVDAYAASRGPGSFTGVRVGLGTVRGLGLAADRPCLGIVSLAALAEAFGPCEAERVPLLDAGRNEVYGARYDPAASPPEEREAPWVGPPGRALEGATPGVLFGPGVDRYRDVLDAGGAGARLGRTPTSIAGGVGRLALEALSRHGASDRDLSPLYLRPADAELNEPAG
jgi:tRNA threonylcarbamoyladenosine biosynthesis protein TsaB